MLKAYKYRLYPTTEQKKLLNKSFGHVRFVYNLALETRLVAYNGSKHFLSLHELTKQVPELKEECPWLKEVNSQSIQSAIRNQEIAWNKFFNHGAGFPRFKKKGSYQSFQCPQNVVIDWENGLMKLPKIRSEIKIILHRPFKGEVKTTTISKTPTGKYFASVLVDNHKELPKAKPIKENTAIGIDLNTHDTCVLSDGKKISNPKFLNKLSPRIKHLQQQLEKKTKGSNHYKLNQLQIAKKNEKVANQRKNFLHHISKELVNNHDTLIFEDLDIKGMSARLEPIQDSDGKYLHNGQAQKSGLNKSILDAGWGMFIEFCKYKAGWQGKNIIQIGRFEPSSKMCSCCGYVNHNLTLEEREWDCIQCKAHHDRDINAAINIKRMGLNKHFTVGKRVEGVETLAKVRSKKRQSSDESKSAAMPMLDSSRSPLIAYGVGG